QLGHLEHADRVFAVEHLLQLGVGVDLPLVLAVLQIVLLDVVPDALGHLGARLRLRADHCREGIVRLQALHESAAALAGSAALFVCHGPPPGSDGVLPAVLSLSPPPGCKIPAAGAPSGPSGGGRIPRKRRRGSRNASSHTGTTAARSSSESRVSF